MDQPNTTQDYGNSIYYNERFHDFCDGPIFVSLQSTAYK